MPIKDYNSYSLFTLCLAFAMTVLGSVAHYSYDVLNGKRFDWLVLLLQLIVSVFSGAVTVLISAHFQWGAEITGGLAGMAGWAGAALIKALEERLIKRISGN
jgi:hypothetical protein